MQDWENVKYNNLKYSLPKQSYLTGYARKAEMYLKHGILKYHKLARLVTFSTILSEGTDLERVLFMCLILCQN